MFQKTEFNSILESNKSKEYTVRGSRTDYSIYARWRKINLPPLPYLGSPTFRSTGINQDGYVEAVPMKHGRETFSWLLTGVSVGSIVPLTPIIAMLASL